MWSEQITLLLSNHRNSSNPAVTNTLTKHQIISLLRSSIEPNQSQEQLPSKIQEDLQELQANGEIYAGVRNSYCIAPPTLLALNRDDLTGLRFKGDRAYLSLAHQVLKSEQNQDELLIHPKIHGFNRIKNYLNQVGIRFLIVADSINYLPIPCKPSQIMLCSTWEENPFLIKAEPGKEVIYQYVPRDYNTQNNRWVPVNHWQLKDKTLLKLFTGEYIWFEDNTFYSLEPDTAILIMFYLDSDAKLPLRIEWDKHKGRLNLQGTVLPSAYARLIWGLSQQDNERYRNRLIPSINQPIIETIFEKLGCLLV